MIGFGGANITLALRTPRPLGRRPIRIRRAKSGTLIQGRGTTTGYVKPAPDLFKGHAGMAEADYKLLALGASAGLGGHAAAFQSSHPSDGAPLWLWSQTNHAKAITPCPSPISERRPRCMGTRRDMM